MSTPSSPPVTFHHVNHKIYERLKLYFALLTALGGLVLVLSTEHHTTPIIAIFFAIFGYIFVDWLRLFSLPPIIAYAAMAVTAVYCTADILLPLSSAESGTSTSSDTTLSAVAELLVLVQAILMLQTKGRRIFEQLGVEAAVVKDNLKSRLFADPPPDHSDKRGRETETLLRLVGAIGPEASELIDPIIEHFGSLQEQDARAIIHCLGKIGGRGAIARYRDRISQ